MRIKFLLSFLALFVFNTLVFAAGDETPAWLKQAAVLTLPSYPKEVKVVVLHDESRIAIGEDGRVISTDTYAIKLLTRAGREQAVARTAFKTDTDKVKEMRAWLLRPNGEVKSYGKQQILEGSLADNDVYNEVRRKTLSAVDDADEGCVFGWEITTESRSIFSQFTWYFQSFNPVVMSRITISLPTGWNAKGITFNQAKLEPQVSGTSYTWELRNLPPIEDEPASPPHLSTRVAINVYPPEGKSTFLRPFATWKDVSRYMLELSEPQSAYNDTMAAKARELTANAKNEFEKIQAIARYAQSVNYISIQTDIGRGGGYRPHAALDVFTKNYGDCKDKANLMRALLKAVGVESHLVSIYSGDPHYVQPEWPSPRQFNHCIIAVKVGDATQAATVIKHAALGRLLIFDPTDEHTPFGDLPDHEQGSLALIEAGDLGDLVRMPLTPPEANKLESTVEAALDAEGNVTVQLKDHTTGQAAVEERRPFKYLAQPDYVKMTERWITRGAPGAAVSKVAPHDDAAAGRFALEVEFKAPAYAKTMRGKLMVFKPALVTRRAVPQLSKEKRTHPVVLEAHAFNETTRIKLPDGFEVDELPDALELNQPFGNFAVSWTVQDGYLLFKRALILRAGLIPVEQYPAVRSFFGRVLGAEQAPVVLAKK